MPDRHTELEFKFDAENVDPGTFVRVMQEQRPQDYECQKQFDDDYYQRPDGLVVRHRLLGGAGELTYKKRRSLADLTDRLEINLDFGPNTEVGDVQGFLIHTGHKKVLKVRKTFAHVFHFVRPDYKVEVSLYEAGLVQWASPPSSKTDVSITSWVRDLRRFLEIEVIGPTLPLEARQTILEDWRALVLTFLKPGPQLNESLYEIYSNEEHSTNYKI